MAKCEITIGSTDQTIDIFVADSSVTTGAGLSGLTFNSAGLTCYYRKGATGSSTQLVLATQTVGGAHVDGGFVEIDSTNMKGIYRLDLSDAMVNTAGRVTILLRGATNMAPVAIELEVVNINKYDAVRMGITALPNANADAAGGLPISDAGGLDLDTFLTRVDTTISSRMATYTQPTGFLAATFPAGTIANTTNITAGTITTVSGNVTGSVGSIATGGIVAGSFAAGAIDAAAIATNAIGASELAADAVTEIQSGLATSAALGTAQADLDDIQTRLPAALVGGRMDASIGAINNSTVGVAGFERATSSITRGTVTTGATTTSIPTSSLSPAATVTDQFKGLILKFDGDTATAALRGQGSDITASTAGGTLTVTALSTAPVSGDIFTIQ